MDAIMDHCHEETNHYDVAHSTHFIMELHHRQFHYGTELYDSAHNTHKANAARPLELLGEFTMENSD
jgi:hypothetical protein